MQTKIMWLWLGSDKWTTMCKFNTDSREHAESRCKFNTDWDHAAIQA